LLATVNWNGGGAKDLFQKRIALFLLQLVLLLSFCSLCLHGTTTSNFQGTVLDRSNFPIADALIKLQTDNQTFETKSDGKGHFEVVVQAGKYNLGVSARGFETREIANFQIPHPKHVVTVILDVGPASSYDPVITAKRYKAGERLDGTVMDEFGVVINNATVTLTSTKKILRTKVSSTGAFAFGHVRPGQYELTISANGFRPKTLHEVRVTREESLPLQIVLDLDEGR
jgi:uncharacterized membrane protein